MDSTLSCARRLRKLSPLPQIVKTRRKGLSRALKMSFLLLTCSLLVPHTNLDGHETAFPYSEMVEEEESGSGFTLVDRGDGMQKTSRGRCCVRCFTNATVIVRTRGAYNMAAWHKVTTLEQYITKTPEVGCSRASNTVLRKKHGGMNLAF